MTKALVNEIRVPSPIKGEFIYNIHNTPGFVNIFFKKIFFYFFPVYSTAFSPHFKHAYFNAYFNPHFNPSLYLNFCCTFEKNMIK